MKRTLLTLLLFTSLSTFAQTSFFIDNKGKKTFIEDERWDIILIDKRVSYKLPGKTWEKYITFGDLDYGVFGDFKFKSFKIDNKKKAYFVHVEEDGKSLVSISVTTTVTQGSLSSSNTSYVVLVVDSESNVLAKLDFHDYKNNIAAKARGELPGMIKKYFPNCSAIIGAINEADTHDDMNLGILQFLDVPIYRSCN